MTPRTIFSFFSRRRILFLQIASLFLLTILAALYIRQPDNAIPEERPLAFSEDWSAHALPFTMPAIRLFEAPDRICSIDAYGAIGDGETSNTQAIALAIDDCSQDGGGTVRVPAGRFVTGPIRLRSDIRLDISEGAELLFSQDPGDYLPPVFSRYEGMEFYGYSPLIYANGCHDIAITGKGLIDGRGQAWWDWKRWQQASTKRLYALSDAGTPVEERVFGTIEDGLRPSLIQFVNCQRIWLEGFTVKNGPMWTIHPLYSKDILIRDVIVTTEGPNNDGIVIDSSKNVSIERVHLDTEDDAIVIKSGVDKDGQRVGIPSENIVIRDCSVGRGNGGVVIGSEMSGGVRNVSVARCHFDGTKRGFRMKSAPGRGGIVENIWVEDIDMENILAEAIFLNMFYDSKNVVRPTTMDPPIFRRIFFKNITCSQANDAVSIVGASDSFIQDISFQDLRMRSRNGISIRNVAEARFENIEVRTTNRPSVSLSSVRGAIFNNPTQIPSYRPSVFIEGNQSADISFGAGYLPTAVRFGKGAPRTAVSYEKD
jgi:polygalacturonase